MIIGSFLNHDMRIWIFFYKMFLDVWVFFSKNASKWYLVYLFHPIQYIYLSIVLLKKNISFDHTNTHTHTHIHLKYSACCVFSVFGVDSWLVAVFCKKKLACLLRSLPHSVNSIDQPKRQIHPFFKLE